MKNLTIIEANPEDHCQCCGRVHRKLHLIDGYWLGGNCENDYRLYKRNSDIKSLVWKGYEKKHTKVARMVIG